jgi:hypothetical protein
LVFLTSFCAAQPRLFSFMFSGAQRRPFSFCAAQPCSFSFYAAQPRSFSTSFCATQPRQRRSGLASG